MTYKNFTNPDALFDKLLERYNVPESVPDMEQKKIKMRVCVFFKNWADNEYERLPDSLIERIREVYK